MPLQAQSAKSIAIALQIYHGATTAEKGFLVSEHNPCLKARATNVVLTPVTYCNINQDNVFFRLRVLVLHDLQTQAARVEETFQIEQCGFVYDGHDVDINFLRLRFFTFVMMTIDRSWVSLDCSNTQH